MEFRAQTLKRLEKFADQKFFKTEDYLNGALPCIISIFVRLQLRLRRQNHPQLYMKVPRHC